MKKEVSKFKSCIQPSPNLIVSCCDNNGENNALAVGYACNCSFDPPMVMVGIVPSRYSYHMIKETGEFVVNLVTPELKEEFNYLGSKSGRDEDKLNNLNLKYEKGKEVDAPVLLDFPVNIECEVIDSLKTGSHEMFAGKVKHIQADSEWINEDGEIKFSELNLL